MSGSYTFDSGAPDLCMPEPCTPNGGIGTYLIDAFDFMVGSYSGAAAIGTINIHDGPDTFPSGDPSDLYIVQGHNIVPDDPVPGWKLWEAQFQLTDLTATGFSDTTLPLAPPAFEDFAYVQAFRISFIQDGTGEQGSVYGYATSLVPEPSTALLVTLGLVGLAVRNALPSSPPPVPLRDTLGPTPQQLQSLVS
jgi:hypothetical protein